MYAKVGNLVKFISEQRSQKAKFREDQAAATKEG
jgi:hypothetical protein